MTRTAPTRHDGPDRLMPVWDFELLNQAFRHAFPILAIGALFDRLERRS
jgi:hypothetical protein